MILLAHGFILTAMLWGGAVAFLIDRKIAAAAATLAACAVLAFFGFIHSITPTGGIYLPWTTGSTLPYHWTAAYLGFAALILLLGRTEAFRLSAAEPCHPDATLSAAKGSGGTCFSALVRTDKPKCTLFGTDAQVRLSSRPEDFQSCVPRGESMTHVGMRAEHRDRPSRSHASEPRPLARRPRTARRDVGDRRRASHFDRNPPVLVAQLGRDQVRPRRKLPKCVMAIRARIRSIH